MKNLKIKMRQPSQAVPFKCNQFQFDYCVINKYVIIVLHLPF